MAHPALPLALLTMASLLLSGCAKDVPPAPVAQETGFTLRSLGLSFQQPIFATHAGDGSGRLFVVEQRGVVMVVDPLSPGGTTEWLDLQDRIVDGGERGLLGLAFHPDFEKNGRLFVDYTDRNGNDVVSELLVSAPGGKPDPSKERILLVVEDPYANHNGGMIAFGPDGKLYVAMGDGGSANDPANRAQSLDSLLGKLLRIDVDAAPAPIPYTIPQDNPFATRTRGAEVWDYGLRNPWRFSFDRQTGDLWIGDVGQNQYEEIDFEPAGSKGGINYGWSRYEGDHLHDADREAPDDVRPVAEYDHDGGNCAVTGGYVYRGAAIPSLQGTYLFGDYCTGYVWSLHKLGAGYHMEQALDTSLNISSFGEDEDGELYVVDHGGDVLKVVAK